MTFRTTLTAALLCAMGCAVLPLADDLGCVQGGDANCTPTGDAGFADGYTSGLDGGYGDVLAQSPSARSSLCGTGTPCTPKDQTTCNPTTDAGDAGDTEACHMVFEGPQTAPVCLSAGPGGDGALCSVASDCAAGFECVGNGTCRHYCCDDGPCTTMTNASTNGTTYFCDVATENGAPTAKVPACLVVVPCMPLMSNTCYSTETCTIVEIDSSASLVATCDTAGTGVLGDSCETEQCAAGFACIGATGQRTCQQLCNAQHPCSGSMNCNMQSEALASFKVGVCGS